MNCERNICYQQEYNGGCDTCPCNRTAKEAIKYINENDLQPTCFKVIDIEEVMAGEQE